jgi:hypothetical protein
MSTFVANWRSAVQKASIYNKIRAILTHLKGKTFEDVYEFSNEVAQKKLEVFELPSSDKEKKFCDPG